MDLGNWLQAELDWMGYEFHYHYFFCAGLFLAGILIGHLARKVGRR